MNARLLALSFAVGGIFSTTSAAGWIEWSTSAGGNGHSYLPVRSESPVTWLQAKELAHSAGGYLVSITSAGENAFVYNLISAPQYWNGEFGPLIGGIQTNSSIGAANGWSWVSGEAWEYTNWRGGQPDDGGIPEDILHFWGGPEWNDQSTNTQMFVSFVVERDICTPHKAKATAELVNGFVVNASITESGCGYTNAPLVLIQGGGGSGATARAEITEGKVSRIVITSAGIDYETPPRIVIASPPFVPRLNISVSMVKVAQEIVLGRRYVLESSHNGKNWSEALAPFTAMDESITNEFDADETGRFFRIREVP